MQQTPEQIAFCEEVAHGNGSILLEAVAGSGKTTTMMQATRQLRPGSGVLACAFNSKTATELKTKLPGWIDTATLNAIGHRAWGATTGRKLEVNPRKMGIITSELCKRYETPDLWAAIKDLSSKAKSSGLIPHNAEGYEATVLIEDTDENWEALAMYHNIELTGGSTKTIITIAREVLEMSIVQSFNGTIDFDDQLYMSALFPSRCPTYNMVLVDEAQDLSSIQHILLEKTLKLGGRLIAVGDPKQAIYGFRGADVNSMQTLATKHDMKRMTLTVNFRCGRVIIERAQQLVPAITAWSGAPDGSVVQLDEWVVSDIMLRNSVVVCRNIFPLVKFGFTLIRAGVGVHMLGRDLGKTLENIAKKLSASSLEELVNAINTWRDNEIVKAKARDSLDLIDWITDMADSLVSIATDVNATSSAMLTAGIVHLFSESPGHIQLSTIHRAKGLEWDNVYFLDPWRVPAKFAVCAAQDDPTNCGWMLEQEDNLCYIATTRAKHNLVLFNMKQYKESGQCQN